MRSWRAFILAGILAVGLSATVSATVDREVSTLDFVVSAAGCPHIHGTLTLTEMSHTVIDSNGGVHLSLISGAHGTATDPDGADQWHVMDQDSSTNFTGAVGQVFTVVENFHLIGPGTEPNIAIRVVAHVTVNADGSITASFEHDTNLDQVGCTGTLPG